MSQTLKIILLVFAALVVIGGALVFSFVGTATGKWEAVITEPPASSPVNIRLVARQSYWTIWYPGEDGVFGKQENAAIDSANALGLLKSDPQGWDDLILTGEFRIPVDEEINFEILSLDVLHAAYMPDFRMKMDAVPGKMTHFRITPDITTEEKRQDSAIVARYSEINQGNHSSGGQEQFNFQLACAEVCGKGHFEMRSNVVVSTRPEYDDWLSLQNTAAGTMHWQKEQK